MGRRQHADPCVPPDEHCVTIWQGVQDDTKIDRTSIQPGFNLTIIRFERHEFNVGMEGTEPPQERWKHGGEDAGKSRYADRASFLARRLRCLLPDRLQMGEGGAGVVQCPFAKGGQLDAVSLPHQQLDTQGFLQRGKRLAYAGLGEPKHFGGRSEAAGFGGGDQATELRQIHIIKTYTRNLFQ